MNRRQFLVKTSAAGLALGMAPAALAAPAVKTGPGKPNSDIRVACIGLRGKGGHHLSGLKNVPGVAIVALCDIDDSVLAGRADSLEKKDRRKIKRFVDYRKLVEDPEIDAVSIATCNHTHTLIAIAALEAGKDVYVEKPCSHNIWEGRQLVATARKYKRMCQHGTQGRSSSATTASASSGLGSPRRTAPAPKDSGRSSCP